MARHLERHKATGKRALHIHNSARRQVPQHVGLATATSHERNRELAVVRKPQVGTVLDQRPEHGGVPD